MKGPSVMREHKGSAAVKTNTQTHTVLHVYTETLVKIKMGGRMHSETEIGNIEMFYLSELVFLFSSLNVMQKVICVCVSFVCVCVCVPRGAV